MEVEVEMEMESPGGWELPGGCGGVAAAAFPPSLFESRSDHAIAWLSSRLHATQPSNAV